MFSCSRTLSRKRHRARRLRTQAPVLGVPQVRFAPFPTAETGANTAETGVNTGLNGVPIHSVFELIGSPVNVRQCRLRQEQLMQVSCYNANTPLPATGRPQNVKMWRQLRRGYLLGNEQL